MKSALALLAITTFVPAMWLLSHAAQDPSYEIIEVRPNAHVIRGAGANVTVVDSGAGLIVIDAKYGRHGDKLRASIESIRRADILYVINTHHHEENTGGSRTLAGNKTRIIAHDEADRRIREAGGEPADLRFRSRLTVQAGEETITCHHKGNGHTDGDAIVHLERAKVLAVGGLVAHGMHPAAIRADGADLRGWIRVLTELERDFATGDVVVVPGDGAPGGIELITQQRDYLRDVLDHMEDAQRHGQSRAEALRGAAVLREKYRSRSGEHFDALLELAYEVAGR